MAKKKESTKLKELETAKDRDLLRYFEASAEADACDRALTFARGAQVQAQQQSALSAVEYLRAKQDAEGGI